MWETQSNSLFITHRWHMFKTHSTSWSLQYFYLLSYLPLPHAVFFAHIFFILLLPPTMMAAPLAYDNSSSCETIEIWIELYGSTWRVFNGPLIELHVVISIVARADVSYLICAGHMLLFSASVSFSHSQAERIIIEILSGRSLS